MARLRTLHIGGQHILVLDDLTAEQADATRHATLAEGMPPILVFDFSVDLPENFADPAPAPAPGATPDQEAIEYYSGSSKTAAKAIRDLETQVFSIDGGILSRLDYLEERTST